MIPPAYEFHWDVGHIIFLGAFYTVLSILFAGLTTMILRNLRDQQSHRFEIIRRDESFHDLPAGRRQCRHEFTGESSGRTCNNSFDCGTCAFHSALMKKETKTDEIPHRETVDIGLTIPENRLYHRGHAWVEPNEDGSFNVGLDDLAAHCLGRPYHIDLPPVGKRLYSGGRGLVVKKGKVEIGILAPVDGIVVEQGGPDQEWLYKMKPVDGTRLDHLMRGHEVKAWMLREMELLQGLLQEKNQGMALADGGRLSNDMMNSYPNADWDLIWGYLSLEM